MLHQVGPARHDRHDPEALRALDRCVRCCGSACPASAEVNGRQAATHVCSAAGRCWCPGNPEARDPPRRITGSNRRKQFVRGQSPQRLADGRGLAVGCRPATGGQRRTVGPRTGGWTKRLGRKSDKANNCVGAVAIGEPCTVLGRDRRTGASPVGGQRIRARSDVAPTGTKCARAAPRCMVPWDNSKNRWIAETAENSKGGRYVRRKNTFANHNDFANHKCLRKSFCTVAHVARQRVLPGRAKACGRCEVESLVWWFC